MKLSEALNAVVDDRLYAKAGQGIVITPDDVPELISTVTRGLANRGHSVSMVKINLDDKKEFIDISVVNPRAVEKENKKANISLQWKTADGTFLVRVDTDGDGL